MSEISEKMESYLDSEIGKALQVIVAYTVRKTKTLKDDEILDNIDDVKDVLSKFVDNIADITPTEDEFKDSLVEILEKGAKLTKTKWDDRLIPIAKMFL